LLSKKSTIVNVCKEIPMRLLNFAAMTAFVDLAMTGQAFATQTPIPEPASLTLLAIGAGGVLLAKLRRRK